jgi:hypothetical protein
MLRRRKYICTLINSLITATIILSCTKSELDEIIRSRCNLTAVESEGSTEKLIYQKNRIETVNTFKTYPSTKLHKRIRFEHDSGEVREYIAVDTTGWSEELLYSFIYMDHRLTQIRNKYGQPLVSYFYNDDKLDYFFYHHVINNTVVNTDSLSVIYDLAGINIKGLRFYTFDFSANAYKLYDKFLYQFDTENNPFRNSLYYISKHWRDAYTSIVYFNQNNILDIDNFDHRSYRYNNKKYPITADFTGSYLKEYYTYECP